MKPKTPFLLPLCLDHISDETLRVLAGEKYLNSDILNRIARIHFKNMEIMEILVKNPGTSGETLLFLYSIPSRDLKDLIARHREDVVLALGELFPSASENRGLSIPAKEDEAHVKKLSLFQRIQVMPVAEKLHFALKTDRDGRSILIKDSNKQVALAVLANPKITEDEVLLIAQSRNVQEEILREICKNRDWTKSYAIIFSLVNNPKTPIALALGYLQKLKEKDLAMLCKNKGIPRVIRDSANRIIQMKNKKT